MINAVTSIVQVQGYFKFGNPIQSYDFEITDNHELFITTLEDQPVDPSMDKDSFHSGHTRDE